MRTLGDAVPSEFHREFTDTRAYALRDVELISEHHGHIERWPGKHRNVHTWWKLASGHCVGWNENPARGWSFPVITFGAKQ